MGKTPHLWIFALVTVLPSFGLADRPERQTSAPGFRPYSEHAASFVEGLGSATIRVHATLLRGPDDDSYDTESQRQIVTSLKSLGVAAATEEPTRIELGKPAAQSQWGLFLNDIELMYQQFKGVPRGEDYHLFAVLLAPVRVGELWAIHCYLVDGVGQNTFSFLLNSHHRSFAEAKLSTRGTSARERAKLIGKATAVTMEALRAQLRDERNAGPVAARPVSLETSAGVFDDFESDLRSGKDPSGIDIGFLPASAEENKARISRAKPPTPLPGKRGGKTSLKLELDAPDWAAVVHKFENETANRWVSYDWSAFNQLSFWLHGRNTGAKFFVDILDNRKPPWTNDDAELYAYAFKDDFSGWKKVTIRFRDMHRKEVGNQAPVDGLGLTAVHGWAFGVAGTAGPVTYYVDDLEIESVRPGDDKYPMNELPMYGHFQKTFRQSEADGELIKEMTRAGRTREEAADTFARMGWMAFYDKDYSSAIKRFNQAWLLHPKNQLALWGFAIISVGRNQPKDAVRYFEMAIEAGPKNADLERDYARARQSLEQREPATDSQ